jgi:alkylation response protein AidB-like acyl-CoA dehydrogenase
MACSRNPHAAKRYDSDERCDIEAGLAKLFASEVAMKVVQTAFRPRESQAL